MNQQLCPLDSLHHHLHLRVKRPFNCSRAQTDAAVSLQASLFSRLEKLFQVSFPQIATRLLEDQVVSLKAVLEPPEDRQPRAEEGEEKKSTCKR